MEKDLKNSQVASQIYGLNIVTEILIKPQSISG